MWLKKNYIYLQDDSKCSLLIRKRIFRLLNDLCDKFNGDDTLSHQPGMIQLCADLLKTPEIADQFWSLNQKDTDCGVVSLWNSALEYFPYNFNALSILSASLAEAGADSVRNVSKYECLFFRDFICEI